MGRYVTGDFNYKFAFGEQSSSLGIILEELESELNNAIYINRYVSTSDKGEIVHLTIEDFTQFKEYLEENYLKDFKDKTDDEWRKWSVMQEKFGQEWHDQNMIKLLLKNIEENKLDYLSMDIEY